MFEDVLKIHDSNAHKLAVPTLAAPTSLPLPHACHKGGGKPGLEAQHGSKAQKGYMGSVKFHSAAGRSLAAQQVA